MTTTLPGLTEAVLDALDEGDLLLAHACCERLAEAAAVAQRPRIVSAAHDLLPLLRQVPTVAHAARDYLVALLAHEVEAAYPP